jgi:hypothetical protein
VVFAPPSPLAVATEQASHPHGMSRGFAILYETSLGSAVSRHFRGRAFRKRALRPDEVIDGVHGGVDPQSFKPCNESRETGSEAQKPETAHADVRAVD